MGDIIGYCLASTVATKQRIFYIEILGGAFHLFLLLPLLLLYIIEKGPCSAGSVSFFSNVIENCYFLFLPFGIVSSPSSFSFFFFFS